MPNATNTLTQSTESAGNTGEQKPLFDSPMIMFVLIIAIFYFIMIRPQMRKDKERKKQIETIRAGVRISFGGGIIGVIEEVKEHTFRVKIAEGTVIEIARGAVNGILSDPAATTPPAPADGKTYNR